MSSDPIGFAGGSNAFAYVDGNPIYNTDQSGLLTDQEIVDIAQSTIKKMEAEGVHRSGGSVGINAMIDNSLGRWGIAGYGDCEEQSARVHQAIQNEMVNRALSESHRTGGHYRRGTIPFTHKIDYEVQENPISSNHVTLIVRPVDIEGSRATIRIDAQQERIEISYE